MNQALNSEIEKIKEAAEALYKVSVPIRILTPLSWDIGVKEKFFADKAKELPKGISYPSMPADQMVADLDDVKSQIAKLGSGNIKEWLSRSEEKIRSSVWMLASCGQPDFFKFSSQLYGTPKQEMAAGSGSSFFFAEKLSHLFGSYSQVAGNWAPDLCHLATDVADHMQKAAAVFGEFAPKVEIATDMSANVLAGPKRIRIRRSACFSDLDIQQLVEHEVMIHVLTSINGFHQKDMQLLGVAHPRSAKTQEGLAVFAEFITNSIDINRFRRIADRVLAIQMAVEGADFLEVYRFFLERVSSEDQAYENTKRVFRGGVITGRAPFTKDIVYLDGLLQIHNFLRIAVSSGRADCLKLLFVGKLDVLDLPAVAELIELKLCEMPKFLPKWVSDPRFLISYLGYSAFLNEIDLGIVRKQLTSVIDSIPQLSSSGVVHF